MSDEFYYDESPYYDELTYELKESLKKSIKEEVLNKMEKLEKENKELLEVKQNYNQIKADFERKKNEYDTKLKDLESEMKKTKLHELVLQMCPSVIMYHVYKDRSYYRIPKCDKCNDSRRIVFTSPFGKEFSDDCPYCGEKYRKFIMEEVELRKLSYTWNTSRYDDKPYYSEFGCNCRICDSDYYDKKVFFNANRCVDDKTFEEIVEFMTDDNEGVYFTSKEKAEEFMNWMNKDLPNNLERANEYY